MFGVRQGRLLLEKMPEERLANAQGDVQDTSQLNQKPNIAFAAAAAAATQKARQLGWMGRSKIIASQTRFRETNLKSVRF